MKFKIGSKVEWKWVGRAILGEVIESFDKPVARMIKGKKIKRNGSPANPAYLVVSEAGNQALKLGSELSKPSGSGRSKVKPKIFAD